ncbi:hypothetical protein FGG08_007024 [Glutinoglossum americanum]|uniref:RagB/SusD domain-containing protein n=1 Tax=Glutinoglossum americanum TaxID=1670608 RepID=A0A9P8L0F4_9PEZI|nr:hypothetical protein FGG08_007024 [Glutinoglossum americanum]
MTANSSLIRSPKVQVLEQVISDLKDAQSMLSMNYIDGKLQAYSGGSIERLRPTFWAATALLARAYLYKSDYVGAEAQANSLINNGTVYKFASLDSVFLKNSTEAIWQLQPVNAGHNTEDAWVMVLPSTGPTTSYPVYLNQNLLSAFEPNDKRKVKWVNSVTSGIITYSYPYKYKSATLNASITEYLMVLRLAEQYLIRAEARAQQGNTSGALSDLNAIRARATLDPFVTTDKATLLAAILHERQVELFTEWGHRWLDLKRFGAIDAVMSIVTPQKANNAPWQSYQQLYPVPVADILLDPNLSQNDKY